MNISCIFHTSRTEGRYPRTSLLPSLVFLCGVLPVRDLIIAAISYFSLSLLEDSITSLDSHNPYDTSDMNQFLRLVEENVNRTMYYRDTDVSEIPFAFRSQ